LTSSSFISESQPGDLLHAPSSGLALSRPGFPARDYPGKMLETTWFRFDREGGRGIDPCVVLWRGTCPGRLSPTNSDLGSIQILTRHCGTKSQTIIQLEGSGTMPGFKAKPNARSICAQESSFHTYHIENGYIITNVTIYNIFTE
jgi:hypothetical protein